MTHDYLCPQFDPYSVDWEPDQRHWSCHCELIAKARADERRQEEARRMSKFGYWHDYRPEMP